MPSLVAHDDLADSKPSEAEACQRNEQRGFRGELDDVGAREADQSGDDSRHQVSHAAYSPSIRDALLVAHALCGSDLGRLRNDVEHEGKRRWGVDTIRQATDVVPLLLSHHAQGHVAVVECAEGHGYAHSGDDLAVDNVVDERTHLAELRWRVQAIFEWSRQDDIQPVDHAEDRARDLAKQRHSAVNVPASEGNLDSEALL
mmetsp:Transcript_27613/g.73329  ORF Transcript_27613/g.73329 Transcript_27613/m.73329 type:complete len:201 (-) Transcript_27613:84-686(-)